MGVCESHPIQNGPLFKEKPAKECSETTFSGMQLTQITEA